MTRSDLYHDERDLVPRSCIVLNRGWPMERLPETSPNLAEPPEPPSKSLLERVSPVFRSYLLAPI